MATATPVIGKVSKFVFQYAQIPTATVEIERVGSDGNASTSPIGLQSSMTGYSPSPSNPAYFYNVLANLTAANPTSGLAGWWKLNDGSGLSAADSSGNGNSGTLWSPMAWTTDQFHSGLTFNDNDNEFVAAPTSLLSSSSGDAPPGAPFQSEFPVSVFAWIKPVATTESYPAILDDGNYYTLGLQNGVVSVYETYATANNTPSGNFLGQENIPLNTWSNVGFTFDGTDVRIYVNGVLDTSTPVGETNSGYVPWDMVFVGDGEGEYGEGQGYPFSGIISDARIYNSVLSDQEVRNLYVYGAGNYAMTSEDSGYTLTAGRCIYPSGDSDCSVTYNETVSPNQIWCDGTTCYLPITLVTGSTIKVAFKYTQNLTSNQTSEITVSGVGGSGNGTAGAPSDFASYISGMSSSSAITNNPSKFSSIPVIMSSTLFNTGTDNLGNLLAPGSQDSHWNVDWTNNGQEFDIPALAVNPSGTWKTLNTASSSWICPIINSDGTPRGAPSDGYLTYTTSFYLNNPDQDLGSASIGGSYAADDYVSSIILNNVPTTLPVLPPPGGNNYQNGYTNFNISAASSTLGNAGFRPGLNTISFVVDNSGAGQTGLSVNFNQGPVALYAYAINVPGQIITYGTCPYTIGGSDCTVTATTSSPDCSIDNGQWCAAGPIPLTTGSGTKVEFDYPSTPATGEINIEAVDNSDNTFTGSTVNYSTFGNDGGVSLGSGIQFTGLTPDIGSPNHSVTASIGDSQAAASYDAEVGYYMYPIGSNDPTISNVESNLNAQSLYSWSGWGHCANASSCSTSVLSALGGYVPVSYNSTTQTGYVTEVVFKYTPTTPGGTIILVPNKTMAAIGEPVTWTLKFAPTDSTNYTSCGPATADNVVWESSPNDTVSSNGQGTSDTATTTTYSTPGAKTVTVYTTDGSLCPSSGITNGPSSVIGNIYINFQSSFQEL